MSGTATAELDVSGEYLCAHSKIAQLHGPIGVDQNIRRLDVCVDTGARRERERGRVRDT